MSVQDERNRSGTVSFGRSAANHKDRYRYQDRHTYPTSRSSGGDAPKTRPLENLTAVVSSQPIDKADFAGRQSKANSLHDTAPLMDASRLKATSISSGSSQSVGKDELPQASQSPFTLRNGRRYLQESIYPLPVDLPEIQRQNLQTLLTTSVFGKALCSPAVQERSGTLRVLELACGSGYWSSLCHDFFEGIGKPKASFIGLDCVPLAPDVGKKGVNWRFAQHDLRKIPLPFEGDLFDVVMLKDLSLVIPVGDLSQSIIDESVRVLKKGGILEIWEHDHIIRSLLPHPPPPPGKRPEDDDCARMTATFPIYPGTPFASAQNKYLRDSNTWIQEALDRKKLSPTPCARISQILLQEAETLADIGYRRLAVPLGELRWEGSWTKQPNATKAKPSDAMVLNEEQLALRQTALLAVVQKIESMEPLLKEVSGKNQEEWHRWWAYMMSDLLENRGASSGECVEVGAWWARKV